MTEDLGHVRANDLGDAGVANYIHDQIEAGYAKATVNRLTETLRQGYALAKLAPRLSSSNSMNQTM